MNTSQNHWSKDSQTGELHLDAGEYVIGTLSEAERAAFESSLETNLHVRAHVSWWERYFGMLTASVSPQIVPKSLWGRIEAALPLVERADPTVTPPAPGTLPNNDNTIARLESSRGRWRFGTLAASAAAVGLGLVALNDSVREQALPTLDRLAGIERTAPAPTSVQSYVAVVSAAGNQPSLIVTVDADSQQVSVRSLGVEKPADKSLELWYVPAGEAAVSVGLVGEGDIDLGALPARGGDLLAISIEQPGGSPTGVAQGPVVYTGTLVRTDE